MKEDNVKYRILHVFGALNRGGAETMIMNIYRKIDKSKIQFDFIVHTEEKCDYDEEICKLGGKIYRIPRYTGKNHLEYKKAWNDFFKYNKEYMIIHSHVRSTASIYLKIAKNYNLTTIAHSHSTSSGKGISAIVKSIYQYRIRFYADYMLACSKESGRWLFGKRSCNGDKFFLIKNAIDSKLYSVNKMGLNNIKSELNLNGKFVIGHIGRFSFEKNHEFIIDVFKEVVKKDDDAVLILIGDGDLKDKIKNKVIKLNLQDKVIFTGTRSDIPNLLQAIDVFLFPSLYEGLPVTLIEAQASGVPCVISDTITNEVEITDLIEYVSLKYNETVWADKVLDYKNIKINRNTYDEIVKSGYDVGFTSKWYQEFLLEILDK